MRLSRPNTSVLNDPDLKDDVHFTDKRQDYTQSILEFGDLDAQADLVGDEEKERLSLFSDSLKEGERVAFHTAQLMAMRPTEQLEPRVIEEMPIDISERTHNQIQLIQRNQASIHKLLNRYNVKY